MLGKKLNFLNSSETSRGRSERTTPLYSDIKVYSQEGKLLFRCGEKKARWYLKRNLAQKKLFKRKAIQLKFEAGGLGDPPEILAIKRKNQCAECGCKKLNVLSKHHIVPYSFRRHMDSDRQSILVIPLCFNCHDTYEAKANKLRKEICTRYNVIMHKTIKLSEKQKIINKIHKMEETYLSKKQEIPLAAIESILNKIEKYKEKYFNLTGEHFTGNEKVLHNESSYDYSEAVARTLKTQEDVKEFERIWINHLLEHFELKYLDSKHVKYLKNY